jgi:8-oxo-dGTP pyrophosphatase MutT (NUDIX family)
VGSPRDVARHASKERAKPAPRREWTVAGAVVEHEGGLLLVCNRRRDGSCDWSTPGGVIDPTDATVIDGLEREVLEETGLRVSQWEGPLYRVTAVALDLGWTMHCEVHRAVAFEGELAVDDPDGIVIDAQFVEAGDLEARLSGCFQWVREPLTSWLGGRWAGPEARGFHYEVMGTTLGTLEVVRATKP